MEYNKIIFVAQTGTCREAMAAGIFGDFALKHPLEIQTRHVLTEYVGDELEILDPYGGALPAYGLCYETLRKSIKKLVKKLNEEEGE